MSSGSHWSTARKKSGYGRNLFLAAPYTSLAMFIWPITGMPYFKIFQVVVTFVSFPRFFAPRLNFPEYFSANLYLSSGESLFQAIVRCPIFPFPLWASSLSLIAFSKMLFWFGPSNSTAATAPTVAAAV